MTPERWLEAIRLESDRLAATTSESLALPVPTCPGWNVSDLLGHVGAVHRWAADRLMETRRYRGYDTIPVPAGAAVIDWYAVGRDLLMQALTSRDPDEPARTFVGERTVAFWYRRQAHELAVHRWDLESATAPGAQTPIDADLAGDGIDEWLEVFVPRFIAAGDPVPDEVLGRTIHLHAHDHTDRHWVLRPTTERFDVSDDPAEADVAIRATADDLLLTVWHRRALDDADVVGDRDLAGAALELVHVT
ncbi:maleylpyruvate isomerase family mycothiol-dependent enzyme [Gordonia sp. NPDC003950]